MDLEEPLEKVDAFTRGPKECKTVSGVRKPGEAENEEDSPGDDEMTNCKEEIKKTRVVYTRDVLNELRDSPASKLWPAFAEEDCVRNGIWDPEVWHHTPASAKRCASPVEDFKRQIQIEDGIVLSPQRQSFGQGCHVHQSAPERGLQQERTKSMISRTIERDTREGRNRLTGRVGRGSRSLDYRSNMRDRNRNGDRQASPWERNDKEQKRGRDDDSYNYKRGRRRHDEDEDPEWMTFGPTSISETIELRGFNKESISRQRGKTGSLTSSDGIPSPITIKDKNLKNQQDQEEQITPSADNKDKQDDGDDDDADFDINQFFTSDSFLQLGDEPEQSASNESRFRQFFGIGGKQGSQNGSRRSSGAEELLEYSGVSSPSTPHTPSPSQKFMFTPIKPIEANTKPESLSEMLEKTKLDVKPMLDTVLSSAKRDEMRIKGLKRLEEIEPDSNRDQSLTATTEKASDENNVGDMTAFISLIEKMKTSGSLPEKPQPVIPGLPSHLLPRPPSPKTKTPRRSPSPLKDLDRSTSPVEFLHHIIQKQQSPSPPQVVPQMNRSYSPLETPLYKSVEKLRRSPSPIQSMYQQKPFSPLLTPDAFMSPSPGHPPYIHNRTNHMMYQVPDKPRFELPNETPKPVYQNQKQTPRSAPITKPKVTPKTQSAALKDLGFMPTSVLQKIKKDQMTPKSKADGENGPKESSNISFESMKMNGPVIEQIGRHTVPAGFTSPDSKRGMALSKDDQLLLKPTAFKPYQGTSPHSVSPHRSGIHSEPQSPQVRPAEGRKDPLPSSAPVTPQRHPQTDRQLLVNLEARVREAANEKPIKLIKTSEGILPGRPPNMVDKPPSSYNKNSHFGNEMMMSHSKRDFEQTMPLSHSIHHQQQQQQQQQQQMRRENVQYLANMGRPRQTPPLAMMGGHSQSILGTPGMPRTPFPVPNMHHGKPHFHHPGMLSSQSLQPGNFRMMPPTRTPSGLPLQSPTSLMQMMPQRHPMMYRHGHTPLHGHPGYPQMMTSHGNFPMQRPHPGFVHQQAKVPNMPSPDNSARQSPSNDNALSKWFSDDVLRGIQSTTPKIPTEIGSKKIMSVEDLERQQALCTS